MPDDDDSGPPCQRQPPQDPAEMAAFEKFYREAVPSLIAFLRYVGASYPLAADLVQDTMIKAYPKWGELAKPHAWCRKVCWNAYRRHQSRVREIAVPDLQDYANLLMTPDSRLEELDEHHRVIAALQKLPARRRAVMAFHYHGATPAEIAELLEMKASTVRSTYRDAKAELTRILPDLDWGTD